jgi:molecular chaperone GrpE
MNEMDDFFSFSKEANDENEDFAGDDKYLEYERQIENCREDLLRAHAENENLRKRFRREIDDAHKYAIQDFVTRMLPAKDSLEKGIDIAYMEENIDAESLFEGMNATIKIMQGAFKAVGLEEIDPTGHAFDPDIHEAMVVRHVENMKPNKVITVFQKGYLLNGRLIRPARVEVSG